MVITSAQNQMIKNLVRLKTKKERDKQAEFLVEGRHMVEEAEQAGLLKALYVIDGNEESWPIPPVYCSENVLEKLSSQKSRPTVIGLVRKPVPTQTPASRFLVLDRVQDPGNVGTLIRSAYAFGIEKIILSKECADPYNPKTLQSSQGAVFHLPVLQEADLPSEISTLKSRNIPVFGTALHHDSVELSDLQIPAEFAVIIGNEGQGISNDILNLCSTLVHIEMHTFESLNAAIAGSIVLYKFQPEIKS